MLKPPVESGIFFDIFSVFVDRGCADNAELSASKSGFEHFGNVHSRTFFSAARSYDIMYLVDKKYNSIVVFNYVKRLFEPFFKLAAISCAGDEIGNVKRKNFFTCKSIGNVAGGYRLSKSFYYRAFAYARFAYEHGAVFRSS